VAGSNVVRMMSIGSKSEIHQTEYFIAVCALSFIDSWWDMKNVANALYHHMLNEQIFALKVFLGIEA